MDWRERGFPLIEQGQGRVTSNARDLPSRRCADARNILFRNDASMSLTWKLIVVASLVVLGVQSALSTCPGSAGISNPHLSCPDFSSTQTPITVGANQRCELDIAPDLGSATLIVEGELIIRFEEDLVVDQLIVASSGWISADGQGFTPGNGPGRGSISGSGGSFGGRGGKSTGSFLGATDARCYGNSSSPTQRGSPGGGSNGGSGGGVVRIVQATQAQIDGIVSANGCPATSSGGGGGSGGGVFISATRLEGTGRIEANGGRSVGSGGGGSGGRVSVISDVATFQGELVAAGGRPDHGTDDVILTKTIQSTSTGVRTLSAGRPFYLTAIRTTGTSSQYVNDFTIRTRVGSDPWTSYKRVQSASSAFVFQGNTAQTTSRTTYLDVPLLAQSLIFDLGSRTNQFYLRAELLGYYPVTTEDISCGQDTDTSEAGGPGTVYIQDTVNQSMVIDNLGQVPVFKYSADCENILLSESGKF
ncbi:uncharacterized protein [Diadema antillarum]|uniref:uncharacterized protein n=1 Tax=Diadema antillarum TaxID=105358 RepID=UPI003A848243